MAQRLLWPGNIEAQRQADAAYARLKNKPKPPKKKRRKGIRSLSETYPKGSVGRRKKRSSKPLVGLDREYYDLVRSF